MDTLKSNATQKEGNSIAVLVADDHLLVSDSVCGYLSTRTSGPVTSRATLEEALEAAHQTHYDAMLLDLDMPGMNGLDSIRSIKQGLPDTKLVIFSGTNDPATIIQAIKAGASGYIPKDMGLQTLMPALQLVVMGEIFLPTRVLNVVLERSVPVERKECVLAPSEIEILKMILNGASNKEIGYRIEKSEGSVKTILRSIFTKLKALNRAHAAHIAQSHGWI